MSSVMLSDIQEFTFDTRFPNVFIDRIVINYDQYAMTATAVDDSEDNAKIDVYLTLKFTKKPYIQAESFENYIKVYLGDLYLYADLTYSNWMRENLENNNLDFIQARKHQKLHYPSGWINANTNKISLRNLVADPRYESKVVVNNLFDSDGNEIIEISNIRIKFHCGSQAATALELLSHSNPINNAPSLSEIESLMFLATIGADLDKLEGTGAFGTGANQFSTSNESQPRTKLIGDRFFGNITYYHVLEYNKVPSQFYQVYTLPSGAPYYDEAIQSNTGRFHATTNYAIDDMTNTIRGLIVAHSELRDKDSALNRNISDLEAIINNTSNRPLIINKLVTYQATFPNKEQNTNSGRFFNDFVLVFADILQNINAQPQLSVRMMFDSLVQDERYSLIRSKYSTPELPYKPKFEMGSRFRGEPSANFIPETWAYITRKSWIRNTEFGEGPNQIDPDQLEKIYGHEWTSEDSTGNFEDGGDFGALLSDYADRYVEQGFPTFLAEELARDEINFQLSEGGQYGQELNLMNPSLSDVEPIEFFSGDICVQNRGFFFFHYEKALRSQSLLGKSLSMEKLQKYFRINVPYDEFYVRSVTMTRLEPEVVEGPAGDEFENYIGVSHQAILRQPTRVAKELRPGDDHPSVGTAEYVDYPRMEASYLTYDMSQSGEATGRFDIMGVQGFSDSNQALKNKYGRPAVFIGNTRYVPFIKFKNFDLPTSRPAVRLDGHENLDYYTTWDQVEGPVMDGYRLMCFEFSDWMDDDVAYYNTIKPNEARKTLLRELNDNGEGVTQYKIDILVRDQTNLTYERFANMLHGAYNDFVQYVSEAREVCSSNNITNAYNEFFVDSINSKYPNKPWIKAAYHAIALSDLIFGGHETALSESDFNERVYKQLLGIMPETGNLPATNVFLAQYNVLVGCIKQGVYSAGTGGAAGVGAFLPTLDTTGQKYSPAIHIFKLMESGEGYPKDLKFYNEITIDQDIFGNVAPDLDMDASSFEITEPAPYCVVRDDSTDSINGVGYYNIRECTPEQAIKYAFEQVFYTDYMGDVWYATRPKGGGMHFDDVALYEQTIGNRMASNTKSNRTNGSGATEHLYSNMTYLCERIFRRSTVDNAINSDNTMAKRRARSGSSIQNRRSNRTLNKLKYLLQEWYLPEVNRRLAFSDPTYVNDPNVAMNNLDDAVDHPDYYTVERRRAHLEHIRVFIEFTIKYLNWQMGISPNRPGQYTFESSGTTSSDLAAMRYALDGFSAVAGDAASDFELIERAYEDPTRLNEIVRSENPRGDEEFASHTNERVAAF